MATRPSVTQPDEPRQVTVRAVLLMIVLLVAFIVLAPTLRAYLAQQQQLRELNDTIAATQERTDELAVAVDRWNDASYVQAQARERLGFVRPGETPYRVIDPETATGAEPASDADSGLVNVPRSGPWYLIMADSVQVAGEVDD
ncbi:MAG: FtsB family cell division protein [Beutenbergiaceae bacterium]